MEGGVVGGEWGREKETDERGGGGGSGVGYGLPGATVPGAAFSVFHMLHIINIILIYI